MQLLIEIEKQQDLQLVMQFLERLKIPYAPLPVKKNGKKRVKRVSQVVQSDNSMQKNFDIDKMEELIGEIHRRGIFADITDPVEWQRQQRNE